MGESEVEKIRVKEEKEKKIRRREEKMNRGIREK